MELCRRAEHAHVAWVTVHGRTVKQRAEPVNNEAVKMVRNLQHKTYPSQVLIFPLPGKRVIVNPSGGQWGHKEFT